MAAVASSLNLAVYVVGFNGQYSSKNYVGCGKSCLCQQFMYNDYSEEPCSTLLQEEFDGCVINRQHTIYWGQKKVMYTSEKEKDHMATFDVFEHTLLYQDGTSVPYSGEKYEKRIFTPLRAFLNKYSFKSREEILYPEEYAAKKFTYTRQLPVAYLYVVDVSQSCPVFAEQLHVMETLINLIKKSRHHCVILASKFDSYCQENVKQLEYCASKLKVDVIQSSSKYNTNIDTTFKYLAVKSLQLKKKHITVNVLSHAESAVEKQTQKIRRTKTSGGGQDCDSKLRNTFYGGSTSSSIASVDKEQQPLVMKRSLSFSGQDTAPIQPLPHSTGTLPKLPKKRTTFVPEIGRSIYISRPTSTRASKPLPKLPFDNGDRQLGHKNKDRKQFQRTNEASPTSTEDYVDTEHGKESLYKNMPDEDSDSSDPYAKIDFGYRDEESEESSPSSSLPNSTSTAVNGATVTNNASIDLSHNVLNKPVSPTADTDKQEDSAVIPSDSTVMLPSPKAAEEDSGIKEDKTEEDINGIDSKATDYSSSSDAYVIEESPFPPPSATPLLNTLIDKNATSSQFPLNAQTTKSSPNPYLYMEFYMVDGSAKHSSTSSPNASPSLTTFSVPVDSKKNEPLTMRPTSTRASIPLPKLPFESVDNEDRQLGHKNKNRKHLQRNNEASPTSTEDYVKTEHSKVPDKDSDSSDAYEKIDFGYRDEESEVTSPSSSLSNGTSTAVNGTIVTNNASIDLSQNVLNKPVSPTTADTAEQEGSAVVPSGSAVMLPSPKAAEGDSDIKYKTEEDVNGIDSKVTEYSTSLVPVDSKKNEPLTISSEHNSAQNSDHTIPNDDAIPSEPTYDDTVVWKFQKRNSGNYLSKLKHNSSLSQSKLCANNSVTVSSHVPVTKKPLQHQMSSSYVKMYRVAPSIPDDNDQLSDTESEVYSYDYLYHKDLMLRKSGRDCNGTPPRNIQRSNYNPSLADYVNISTQQDYVNFKVIESHSMVCPPRACSTKNGTGAAQVKPKPKQRANYRPLYPARDNPRPGYFLSGPLAKPS